ncbi:hypothetical protein GDO78_008345 [Eleutherodactylus coqui]|uniref:Uncharacterized protein n=1 Tax=Eleutherodactylus coqui TaxID=57060 RepID=A0A8J6KDT7_ELECQ|nr:hypothetical protein GDO78_008345 [Eleutherodactylus coqui]
MDTNYNNGILNRINLYTEKVKVQWREGESRTWHLHKASDKNTQVLRKRWPYIMDISTEDVPEPVCYATEKSNPYVCISFASDVLRL